jgi:hypothetical protein
VCPLVVSKFAVFMFVFSIVFMLKLNLLINENNDRRHNMKNIKNLSKIAVLDIVVNMGTSLISGNLAPLANNQS